MRIKKPIAILICFVFLICLTACSGQVSKRSLKIGFLTALAENDVTVSIHLSGLKNAMDETGIQEKQLVIKADTSPENAYETVQSLVSDGCDLIFADGVDLEDAMVQASTEQPDVDFCVFKGLQATNGLANYHTYSFREFESRYVSGILAGEKLNDLITNGEIQPKEAVLGYIATERNADNISAYTAFSLGVRAVCETARTRVHYLNKSGDEDAAKRAALALISYGCKMIAQQEISFGAVAAVCEENNVYYFGTLKDVKEQAPNFYVSASSINLDECYSFAIQEKLNGSLPNEWSKGTKEPAAFLLEPNESAFTSKDKLDKAMETVSSYAAEITEGTRRVFDTKTWSVKKKPITSTVGYDEYFGKEYISENGYFMENELSSIPKFEFHIDGITELNPNEITFESLGG